jgi:hypothetical protein
LYMVQTHEDVIPLTALSGPGPSLVHGKPKSEQ